MYEDLKTLKKFIVKTQKFDGLLNRSLSNKRIFFTPKEHKYLEKFYENIYFLKTITKELNDELYQELHSVLSETNLESRMRDLTVYCKSYPTELDGILSEPMLFKNVASSLIKFIAYLKMMAKTYQEISEKEQQDELLSPTNINKQIILEHVEESMKLIKNDNSIPQDEKEKIVYIHETIIKEVKKDKTLWSKVIGLFHILGTACTLYVSTPIIYDELNIAYNGIISGYNPSDKQIEKLFDPISIPKYKLEEQNDTIININRTET